MADINGVSSYRNTLTMPKAAPYGGGGGPDIDSTVTVKTGTSANQADLMGGVQFTIAASGNATKDLRKRRRGAAGREGRFQCVCRPHQRHDR